MTWALLLGCLALPPCTTIAQRCQDLGATCRRHVGERGSYVEQWRAWCAPATRCWRDYGSYCGGHR